MKKKKTIRNILIAVLVAAVIAAAVFLTIALRKDGHGMNLFQRSATAASADGVKISMIEYALSLDTLISNNSADPSTMSDELLKEYQDNAVNQALLVKVYAKEAKKLGLALTDEEVQKSKEAAQSQIDAIVENYTESLISGGSFSKAQLDKQVANYYTQIGMNQSRYYAFIKERAEASYYQTKLNEYYTTNGSGFTEDEILTYYHDTVKETMSGYSDGMYSMYTQFYAMGYTSPLLFVPEGFLYVDYVKLSKDTQEEINAIVDKINSEEMTFEELMASDDNVDSYKTALKSPYAIGENDYSYLCSEEEFYTKATELEMGEIGTLIVPVKGTAEEGEEAPITGYTGYLFRRAEGNMCEEGDSGIIKIDYYDGVRESVENGLREERWMGDLSTSEKVYGYKGVY